MKRCPKCNSVWPDAANFCPVDGGELDDVSPEEPSEAKTRVMPAVSDEPVVSGPAESVAPAKPACAPKKRRFSETAWFMAAQSPEDLADVELGQEAELATEKYTVEGELDSNARDQYSLRKGAKSDESRESDD